MRIRNGAAGRLRSAGATRSGLAAKFGVTVLNAPGTIDCDYRGGKVIPDQPRVRAPFTVQPGMRIAQMVIAAVERVEWA